MTVYIATFITSYILCIIGERCLNSRKHKNIAIAMLVLSVLVVAIIAGLRDNSVGSDTRSYTTYYIEYGRNISSLRIL